MSHLLTDNAEADIQYVKVTGSGCGNLTCNRWLVESVPKCMALRCNFHLYVYMRDIGEIRIE